MQYVYIGIGVYVVVISLVAVIMTIWDKYKAATGGWRVRERTLFITSALGGSLAMYITMQLIRHKTQHLSFMIGIPLIFVAQVAVVIAIVALA